MGCKLFVALQLKVGRARRVEDPRAFRATKTTKTLLFDPYQLPTHDGPSSLRPSLSECQIDNPARKELGPSPLGVLRLNWRELLFGEAWG